MSSIFYNWLESGLSGWGLGAIALYFLIVVQLTIFAVTLYLHRSQAHRGVDFHPLLAHFFRFWTWLTTSMITREWAAIHRKHHAKCETAEDPHSPQILGLGTVMGNGVELYRAARADHESIEKYGKGCPDDWIERHLYTPYANYGPILMLLINVALFGVLGVAVWALQMLWIPFWAAGVVNGLGHWWGYRNFETDDTSTNLTPWAFFIGGEELHNNHHAFPSSSRFALRRFEFDIGWVVIRALQSVGLAKVRRVAPQLDIRPNITLPDTDTLRAILVHRFQVMSDYFRGVIVPTLRCEAQHAGDSLRALPRRMRKALINGGRWLDDDASSRLREFIAQRPNLATVYEFRQRLRAVYERSGQSSDAMLESLRQWCREAEASGNEALATFSARLKGYALVPVRG
ncbi:MAG: fatty acid desaturase [Xanthomonadaceae bacterium]|nr:fatty acid desaturase [Xanthomonadaceae bacterium]MDP2186184.1 fatty acid desaturase [Xanthomonadales bacterium]MDZ4114903.1 fatty acid desaturase [Xanthomonadaceae bacterium]MDZ4377479.1 fatty acid desaturase [Xanthomonadaceae bacterium]